MLLPPDLKPYFKIKQKAGSVYSATKAIDYKFPTEFTIKPAKLPKNFDMVSDLPMDQVTRFLNEYYFLPGEKPDVAKPEFTEQDIQQLLGSAGKCFTVISRSNEQVIAGVIGIRRINYILNKKCLDSYLIMIWCVHPELRGKNLGKVLFRNGAVQFLQQEGKLNGFLFQTYKSIPGLECPLIPLKWMTRPLNFDRYRISKEKAALIQKHCELIPVQLDCMRVLRRSDAISAMGLYQSKMRQSYSCYQVFTASEFLEAFLPQKGTLYSYLITNTMGELKDFVSFSLVKTNKGLIHGYLKAITYPKECPEVLKVILTNTLFIAKRLGCDIFFVQEQQGIGDLLRKELFFCDTGQINYTYILNYDNRPTKPDENALVL